MRKKLLTTLFLIQVLTVSYGQYNSLNVHSHNDYEQKSPFFLAYNAHFGSIEADIWAIDGELFVAHGKAQINPLRTLDKLYIQPIVAQFRKNDGKAWNDFPATFQLLIDLKTEVEPTLSLLVDQLKKYPEVFDQAVNKNAVHVTITGNRPAPAKFGNYPGFIYFDGNINLSYDSDQLKRVALFSENLADYTFWKGTGAIPVKEASRLKQIIDSVHGINKPIRFWNAPDNSFSWKILMNLKVDFINTDHIPELSSFLTKQ
jgi:alkaline phosphatase